MLSLLAATCLGWILVTAPAAVCPPAPTATLSQPQPTPETTPSALRRAAATPGLRATSRSKPSSATPVPAVQAKAAFARATPVPLARRLCSHDRFSLAVQKRPPPTARA